MKAIDYPLLRKLLEAWGNILLLAMIKLSCLMKTVVSPLFSLNALHLYVSCCYVERIITAGELSEDVWNNQFLQHATRFISDVYSLAGYTDLIDLNVIGGVTNVFSLNFDSMRTMVNKSINAIKKALAKFQLQFDKSYLDFVQERLIK